MSDSCFDLKYDTGIWPVLETIAGALILIITLIIDIIAMKLFGKMKKLLPVLKYLFHLSAFAIIVRCVCMILSSMACICDSITLLTYYLVLLCLLATLIVRLKFTFQDSIYCLTKPKLWAFRILFVILFFIFFASQMLNIFGNIYRITDADNIMYELHPFMVYALLIAIGGMILYIIIGTWAVIEFSNNLLSLTKTAARSMKNVWSHSQYKKPKLTMNSSQHRMIDRIARYNALFSLAAITSTITLLSTAIFSIYFGLKGIPGGGPSANNYWIISLLQIITLFDSLINIICLFLQYSFATKYYNQCCRCLDSCWKSIVSKNLRAELRQEFNQIKSVSNDNDSEFESEVDQIIELYVNENETKDTSIE